jgi:endonuclease YncB( thermonuclease family)
VANNNSQEHFSVPSPSDKERCCHYQPSQFIFALISMGCSSSKNSATRQQPPPAQCDSAAAGGAVSDNRASAPPPTAQRYRLVSIYDGDTITVRLMVGGANQRVRLAAIDTPELKEKEPFAVEARELIKSLLSGADSVYIDAVLGADGTSTDHFGRLLGVVYTVDGVCVNLKLVESGYANVYLPYGPSGLPSSLVEALQAARKAALASRVGIWSRIGDTGRSVLATTNGKAYHAAGCEHLRGGGRPLTIGVALDRGLTACRTCHP